MASVAFGMEEASLLQRERGKRTTNFVGDSEFLVVLCWGFFRGGGGGGRDFLGGFREGGEGGTSRRKRVCVAHKHLHCETRFMCCCMGRVCSALRVLGAPKALKPIKLHNLLVFKRYALCCQLTERPPPKHSSSPSPARP